MNEKVFELGRFQLVEFKSQLVESKNSMNCKILSESSHWTIYSHQASGASAYLGCLESGEPTGVKYYSNIEFLVPVSQNGEALKIELNSSTSYKPMTEADCVTAKMIFARFPKDLKSLVSDHNLSWTFHCQGGPREFRGVIDVVTKR